jgi:hypothetical protein
MAVNVATLTAAVLHLPAPAGVAPANAQVLPCGVIASTAGAFVWTDVNGNTITTQLVVGIYTPIAPSAIQVTSVPAVTVFWQPEP